MPIYEFRYATADGRTETVERSYRMSEVPDAILVEDGEEIYRAERIISLTAKMATNWSVNASGNAGVDLPPPNAPFIP